MDSTVIPQIGHFMNSLPAPGGFYEETPPKTTKLPVSYSKKGKNIEKPGKGELNILRLLG
jgi:hypothetical protein